MLQWPPQVPSPELIAKRLEQAREELERLRAEYARVQRYAARGYYPGAQHLGLVEKAARHYDGVSLGRKQEQIRDLEDIIAGLESLAAGEGKDE